MEISSNSSVQGLQRAFATTEARAKRIANPETDPQFEKDMAELPSDKETSSAQIKVIKTKDQMLGDLLDMLA